MIDVKWLSDKRLEQIELRNRNEPNEVNREMTRLVEKMREVCKNIESHLTDGVQ